MTDSTFLDRAPAPLRPTLEVIVELAHEWKADRVSGLAAEVAFYAILALFPALLAFAAALGSLEPVIGASTAASIEADVLSYLSDTMSLDRTSTTYQAFQNLFDGPSPGLVTFGLVGSLIAVSRGFAALIRALDVAYDLEEHRPWLKLRLTAVGLSLGTVVVGAAVMAMIIVGPLLGVGGSAADQVGLGSAFAFFWDVVRWPLAFVVLIAWMTTLFHIAPNHHTPWRSDLIGAAVSAVLVLAVSLGFRLYLMVASDGNEVFGVLGSAITLLLWLYFQSVAVLIGGELNAVLWARRGEDKAQG